VSRGVQGEDGRVNRLTLLCLLALPAAVSATVPACPLDCDGNGMLAPAERTLLPRAIFESPAACVAVDVNDDGTISAADLTRLQASLVSMADACLTPTSEWTNLAPLAEGARQEIGVAEVDGIIYAIGGFEAPFAGQSARVEAYDIAADVWRTVAPLPLSGHHIGAGVAAGHVYAVGGLTSLQFNPRGELFRYRADIDAWEQRASMPTPRGALAVATVDDKLHAIGGFGPGVEVADHAAYDPASDSWQVLAPLPGARDHLAAVVIDEFIYVVGGRTPNTAQLDRYDVRSDTWVTLAPMPTARSGHAAAAIDGKLVVLGGEVDASNPPNRVFVEVELYDPETNRWVSLAPMPVPRHGMGALTVSGRIYVPGGAFRAAFGASAHNDALLLHW